MSVTVNLTHAEALRIVSRRLDQGQTNLVRSLEHRAGGGWQKVEDLATLGYAVEEGLPLRYNVEAD